MIDTEMIVLTEFTGEEEILDKLVGATVTRAEFREDEDQVESVCLDFEKCGIKMAISFDSLGCWHYGDDLEKEESEITLKDINEDLKSIMGMIDILNKRLMLLEAKAD